NWLVTLLVIGCVAVFTLLAGARIPVVRAALMVLIYLLARLVYRQRALLNSIAAAGLILLVLHPHSGTGLPATLTPLSRLKLS
ncbi:ComEC/Rec2 family competence protein, partial [bacterium]|nr:ComEC/Rec2 family competence protein [bacterium]